MSLAIAGLVGPGRQRFRRFVEYRFMYTVVDEKLCRPGSTKSSEMAKRRRFVLMLIFVETPCGFSSQPFDNPEHGDSRNAKRDGLIHLVVIEPSIYVGRAFSGRTVHTSERSRSYFCCRSSRGTGVLDVADARLPTDKGMVYFCSHLIRRAICPLNNKSNFYNL